MNLKLSEENSTHRISRKKKDEILIRKNLGNIFIQKLRNRRKATLSLSFIFAFIT